MFWAVLRDLFPGENCSAPPEGRREERRPSQPAVDPWADRRLSVSRDPSLTGSYAGTPRGPSPVEQPPSITARPTSAAKKASGVDERSRSPVGRPSSATKRPPSATRRSPSATRRPPSAAKRRPSSSLRRGSVVGEGGALQERLTPDEGSLVGAIREALSERGLQVRFLKGLQKLLILES